MDTLVYNHKYSPLYTRCSSLLRGVVHLLCVQGIPCSVWGQRHLVWAPSHRWHGGPGHEIWGRLYLGLQELRWRCAIWLCGTRLGETTHFYSKLTIPDNLTLAKLHCTKNIHETIFLLLMWFCVTLFQVMAPWAWWPVCWSVLMDAQWSLKLPTAQWHATTDNTNREKRPPPIP